MKLELQSKVNQKEYPFLHDWDQDHRQNYAKYQDEIDKLTHGLQRVQRGFFIFGQSTYPNFHQRKLLNLQLYKQKQLLGKVSQSEIDSYKQVNPEIAQDYNNTFNSQFRVPKNHIIFGALTFPVCHYMNIQYTFRLGLFLLPVAVGVLSQSLQTDSLFKTQEFLDWVYQERKAKAMIELHKNEFEDIKKKYQQAFGNNNRPINERFQQLVDLVKTEI